MELCEQELSTVRLVKLPKLQFSIEKWSFSVQMASVQGPLLFEATCWALSLPLVSLELKPLRALEGHTELVVTVWNRFRGGLMRKCQSTKMQVLKRTLSKKVERVCLYRGIIGWTYTCIEELSFGMFVEAIAPTRPWYWEWAQSVGASSEGLEEAKNQSRQCRSVKIVAVFI